MADELLIPYDIWTNRAHSLMLAERGLISEQTLAGVLRGLNDVERLHEQGHFVLAPDQEDVHMNIEAHVTATEGVEVGGWMHIGRSRNDQTCCDIRLYLRDIALRWLDDIKILGESLLTLAEEHLDTVMPGFTHYQPGMITTFGHWVCSYVQALGRDQERFTQALRVINRNPLGAAASFGTSWPIDRELTSELLGYERVEINSLDCITARWECEAELAHAIAMHMNHLSVMAQDLIILSLPYVGGIQLDRAFVTGSSIMPQKKNPDFAEVIKSKASLAHGYMVSLMGIQKGGLSGYNRDTQVTKYLIMDLIRECQPATTIMRGVFESLDVRRDRLRSLCEVGFMNAVDVADWLARQHKVPFRTCYQVMGSAVSRVRESGGEQITYQALQEALNEANVSVSISPEDLARLNDPQQLVNERQHIGSPAANRVREQAEDLRDILQNNHTPALEVMNRVRQARAQCKQRISEVLRD
jgi:argininosuccinate lyase